MTSTTSNEQQAIAAFRARMEQDKSDQVDAALDSIAKAEYELSEIREQLIKASTGKPYRRIGRIETVDSGVVFQAFGTMERLANFDKQFGSQA